MLTSLLAVERIYYCLYLIVYHITFSTAILNSCFLKSTHPLWVRKLPYIAIRIKYSRTLSTAYNVLPPICIRALASVPILRAVSRPQDSRAANPSISTVILLVGNSSLCFVFLISYLQFIMQLSVCYVYVHLLDIFSISHLITYVCSRMYILQKIPL